MSILSLTFHCIESTVPQWEQYARTELKQLAHNLYDVEKYILSDVESEMLNEGRNTNLLLIFETVELRATFLENEFENIRERVEKRFGDEVMIFKTLLNEFKETDSPTGIR